MSDIEFLEPDGDLDADEPPPDRRVGRPATPRLVGVADVVLTVAGSVLLVVACFRTAYSISLGSRFSLRDLHVDGWGRLQDTTVGARGQHATRFGIVSCVAAGLALLGLVVRAASARRPAVARVAAGVGFAAAGAAAATVGLLALSALATVDTYRAALEVEQLDPSANGLQRRPITVEFGGFVWLTSAGVVCLVLALVAPGLVAHLRRRRPDSDPTGGEVDDTAGDDDQLR